MILSGIYSYPLKSGKALVMEQADILSTGICYDRSVVAIDKNNKVITGREFPELTSIFAKVSGNTLLLSKNGSTEIKTTLPTDENRKISFHLFRNEVEGLVIDTIASEWLAEILGTACRLVSINDNFRPIASKHGGRLGDEFGYADASPIHLISEESLNVLNSRLNRKVTPLHFRANLVVKGSSAFEEDNWETLHINNCVFEVHNRCKRCIFTTIDPSTSTKDDEIEPLTSLAKFRKERGEPLTFGIYLVPRKTGKIHIRDTVTTKR